MGKWAHFAILLAALALAACAGGNKADEPEPNIFPTEYKKEIILTLQNTLDDATNIRDAGITEPALRPVGNEQRYAVCVRHNSRDQNRQYTGVTTSIAIFFAGRLNQLVTAPEQCGKANFKPFPELEQICYAARCN
ncbi:MAG: hypothetical protein Q8M26_13580 [Pseudolabrys sp.]|nr:hypothetical protein [Pseudolabrys sp.]